VVREISLTLSSADAKVLPAIMYLLSPQPKQGSCAQVTGHAAALDAGEFGMIVRRYGDRPGLVDQSGVRESGLT
jgi:hypothetical protein